MDRTNDFEGEWADADILIPDFHGTDTGPDAEPEATPETTPETTRAERGPDRRTGQPAKLPPVCLAFQGVGGGAGTTSLAIATAHQLSRRAAGKVCLVDLDFELGALAHYLDIGNVPRIDDLRAAPSRIDETYIRSLISHHPSGLAVLPSPGVAAGNELANPAAVLAILDRLSDMYPVLVLDVPRTSRPWTDAALVAADAVALVGELHIPALHLARQTLSRLDTLGVGRAEVVLNKYERRSFKASIRLADAERALGRPVCATVGLDMQAPFEAINCGEPGGRLESDSRFSRDLAGLAVALAPALAEKRQGDRRSGKRQSSRQSLRWGRKRA